MHAGMVQRESQAQAALSRTPATRHSREHSCSGQPAAQSLRVEAQFLVPPIMARGLRIMVLTLLVCKKTTPISEQSPWVAEAKTKNSC